ncbi:amino acid ABC transporter permease [Pseudomonas asiatica]|uniref:amino acid ABC transporter permease n=1 Tax=Pseudomonas asiatica TaxID=2219225 RepID=UPI0025704B23|nr:amino acid ABC transporter permease [Pseudomonas asiatica]WJD72193.1 amino acid ABC transporter permease [Pseudomonas asiatica]
MHLDSVFEYAPFLLKGAWVTLQISIGALLLSIPTALLWAGCKLSGMGIVARPVAWMINIVRGTPMIVLLFYFYFVAPDLGISLSSMQAATIGLAFAYSAYIAEIFRAGIEAVDTGQMEAARSIGMSRAKALRRVVLPQAFRISLPPLANNLVMMVKDSALASTIAVTEMTRQGQLIAASTFDNTTVYTLVALLYLALTLPMMQLTKYLENHLGKHRGAA